MKGKPVLILGGSRGIGRATALALAQEGATLGVSYHSREDQAKTLREQIQSLGGICHIFPLDLGDPQQIQQVLPQAVQNLGGLEGLVISGGMAQSQLATDTSISQWNRILAVHLSGTFFAIQAVLPGMISQKRGSIVTLSSVWGQTGASCEVAYSAAKGGVIALTKALGKELGPSGIRVNCVAPGVIDTQMISELSAEEKGDLAQEAPLCRLGRPEEVAATIRFLLSQEASFITGQVLSPNGGFYC